MRKIRLGRTGARVPGIGLGAWGHGGAWSVGESPVGWSGHDDGEATAALVAAHAAGITHWDTADVYGQGRSERLMGSLWRQVPRQDLFLASKVGWIPGPHGHPYDRRQIRAQLEASLRNLATDSIDLYYFHRCEFGPGDRYLDEAVDELRRARAAGKIRCIGLSDWSTARVAGYAARVDPDVVQVHRTVLDDAYEASGLAAWVAAADRGAVFFSPLLHGLLLGSHREPPAFGAGDHRLGMAAFRDAGLLAGLRACRRAVEERFAAHPEPVLHALTGALLADSPTACVLLGLRRPSHVRAAAEVGEALSAADAGWVRRLYRALPGAAALASPWQRRQPVAPP